MYQLLSSLVPGLLPLLLFVSSPQESPIEAPPEPYRVSVELAILQATVRDARGGFVSGLAQDRFTLLEDGEPREIVLFSEEPEAPVRVAFLLDVSGSMALQDRLPMSRSAIRYFMDRLDTYDEAALFTFAQGEVSVVADFTADRWDLQAAMLPLEGYGQTALIDAVAHAPGLVPRDQPLKGAILLFSDGMDNISRLDMDQAVDLARRTQVPVYAIGLLDRHETARRRKGAKVLARFARETGGEAYFAQRYVQVKQAAAKVAERLKQSYVLGYYPTPGSAPHTLEIRADCKGCRVESRGGVYASSGGRR